MRYFKIVNLSTGDIHYVSSTLPDETTAHVALTAHLDSNYEWEIKEVTYFEFMFCSEGPSLVHDLDVEDDSDQEDYDDEYCD
jgi:hypothetical protein